jgi:hypothetical protein
MKTYRTTSGPFSERPYYTDAEIETICEDELRAAGLYPVAPSPVRIDRFIEKRFGVTPRYEELGDGILGFTVFGARGVQDVVVAKALDEEGTLPADRRIRTTLAHEAGHGLLHAHLFGMTGRTRPLFGDFTDPDKPKILCRDVPVTRHFKKPGYDGRWWEFQANRTIGPLLLPRPLAQHALEPFLLAVGSLGSKELDPSRREQAVQALADQFKVNPVVARIRLQDLYPERDEHQLSL